MFKDLVRRMTPMAPEALEFLERREQESKTKKATSNLAGDLGKRYTPREACLQKFQVYHPSQTEVLNKLKGINLAELIDRGGGLIFLGPVGTGKDMLAAALMYQTIHAHQRTCRSINGREWFGKVRDSIGSAQLEEGLVNPLFLPDVLTISDPVSSSGQDLTGWQMDCLYRVINGRYKHRRSTWITLNAASIEDADKKLSAPVFDRLLEQSVVLQCFWPSHRERSKCVVGN